MEKTITFAESLPNLHQEKLEDLKKLLPNLFDKDGNLIKSELENFTQNYTEEKQEPFVFSWAGKQKAKGMAFKQSETKLALKFDEKRSKNFDKTENLIIEGDNLHVLKALVPSYKGKVKCIYIDPPYNTQNDFIYPDNFAESEKEYLLNSGQIDLEGEVIVNDRIETAGRKHSVWLSMMYPRLVLARELLREDGVIFISIDDHEMHHLRHLINEIFGEESVKTTLIWQKSNKPLNRSDDGFSSNTEFVICVSKSESLTLKGIKISEKHLAAYKNPDNDPRGKWIQTPLFLGTNSNKPKELLLPWNGEKRIEKWFVSQETLNNLFEDNRIWRGLEGNSKVIYKKNFLSEKSGEGMTPSNLLMAKDFGFSRNGTENLRELFETEKSLFPFPKPVKLLKFLIGQTSSSNDIILDFFAGSGTTGQAVMELNQEEIDKKSKAGLLTSEEQEVGGRKFILVQLPEKINQKKSPEAHKLVSELMKKRGDENKPPVISEITIERCRRAGQKYNSVDSGFKVMSVTESALSRKFMNSIQATEQEIFAEIALSYGYGLNFKISKLLDGAWKLAGNGRGAVILLGGEQLSNEAQKQIILLSDKLKDCQIFAQDACLNVEIIHNLYQHFEQKKVVIL